MRDQQLKRQERGEEREASIYEKRDAVWNFARQAGGVVHKSEPH
jgi:hypothetical protein